MMTSSVSLRTKSRLRNSVPSTGIFDRPGKPLTACRTSSRTRPAIIIEPPDGSSTVVSARRLRIDSAVMPGRLNMPPAEPPPKLTEPSVVGSETDVRDLQADASRRQHDRLELEADAVFELFDVVGELPSGCRRSALLGR